MTAALPDVRRATNADVEALGQVLAAAFDDDQVLGWFVREDERHGEMLQRMLGENAAAAIRDGGECYLTTDERGAAVWRPPHAPSRGHGDRAIDPLEICGAPERVERMEQFGALMSEHHPDAPPHLYLSTLGVVPNAQSGGIGSAVIGVVLERCDRERVPVYLANTKQRNLAFYERHGFVASAPFHLPGGGPPIWPMWRDPR